jgi:hypothetical protein
VSNRAYWGMTEAFGGSAIFKLPSPMGLAIACFKLSYPRWLASAENFPNSVVKQRVYALTIPEKPKSIGSGVSCCLAVYCGSWSTTDTSA